MADLARIRVWAEALIRLHLPAEQYGTWTFAFDNAKKRAGACHYTTKRITFSKYLAELWEDDDIHQTLLHEVAHAIAGPKAGHSKQWRDIAASLGYEGKATHNGPTADQFARWHGVCPAGHEFRRHRRPTREASCMKCSKRFDKRFLIRWREVDTPAGPRRSAR